MVLWRSQDRLPSEKQQLGRADEAAGEVLGKLRPGCKESEGRMSHTAEMAGRLREDGDKVLMSLKSQGSTEAGDVFI